MTCQKASSLMLSQHILSPSDFLEQPEADARGRIWVSRAPVPSELGPFSVEITGVLDDEVVSTANEALGLLVKDRQAILNWVYGLYTRAAEDRRWMKTHGVPRDLSRGEVLDYISDRFVVVRRASDGRASGSISIRVRWDDEHSIRFGVRSGRLVFES